MKAAIFLLILGFTALPVKAEPDPLQKVWSDHPSVSLEDRASLSQALRKARSQNLPADLLINRLREGLTKGVPPPFITRRLKTLTDHLVESRDLIRQLNLAPELPNAASCTEGLATLFELGLTSASVLEIRRLWPEAMTCQNLVKALEWSLTAEKEAINEGERHALLKKAMSSHLVEKLPYLWVRGHYLGLTSRQILNVVEKGLEDGLSDSQILLDFERVSELLDLERDP